MQASGLSVLSFNRAKWSNLYKNLTANAIFRHLYATDRILLNWLNVAFASLVENTGAAKDDSIFGTKTSKCIMDLIKDYTPFSWIYDYIRYQFVTYNICRGPTRGNIIYVQLIQDDQMLKQQSCIKENIHVLLLWRSHHQEGRVAFGIYEFGNIFEILVHSGVPHMACINDYMYITLRMLSLSCTGI
jgi:hypothetical protein